MLFEEDLSIPGLFKEKNMQKLRRTILKSLPANILAFGSFYLMRKVFIPETHKMFGLGEYQKIGVFEYFSTQWYVISHYLANFLVPLNLSADPDIYLIRDILDQRIVLSLMLILTLVTIAIYCSTKKKLLPVSFGILWFFIALAPTSSFHPLGQISNDHRTFFPYIGLTIAVGWYIFYLWNKLDLKNKLSYYGKVISITALTLVFFLHAYGTYQRNEVWNSAETLWYDVTVKSPNNARGLMNYGITQMSQGKYERAMKYFQKALALEPNYSYLHINLGILNNALRRDELAEKHFKTAKELSPNNVEAYIYYGNWLIGKGRMEEAERTIEQGLRISPGHVKLNNLNARIQSMRNIEFKQNPGQSMEVRSPEQAHDAYINQSIQFYQSQNYEACIRACKEALKLNPRSHEAYNNICTALIKLKRYDEAIKACEKALEIKPDFKLAKNNVKWANDAKKSAN